MSRARLIPFLLLLLLSGLGRLSGAEIYLHRVAVVEGPRLTLGRLATVAAADPRVRARLEELDLGQAPDRFMLLPLRGLGERLHDLEPDGRFGGERVNLVGERIALLPSRLMEPGSLPFYRDLLFFLDRQDRGSGDPYGRARLEVEVRSVSPLSAASVPQEPPAFAIDSPASAFRPALSGEVRVRWESGRALLEVTRHLPVAVAARDLKPGEWLEPSALRLEERPVEGIPPEMLREAPEAGRYRVAVRVGAGDPVPMRSLQKILPVRAGDRVSILFSRPGLRVKVPGRAFGSGGLRETVEVVPLSGGVFVSSPRRFQGVVTGTKEVEVALP